MYKYEKTSYSEYDFFQLNYRISIKNIYVLPLSISSLFLNFLLHFLNFFNLLYLVVVGNFGRIMTRIVIEKTLKMSEMKNNR